MMPYSTLDLSSLPPLLGYATTFPIVPLRVATVLDDSYPAPKHRKTLRRKSHGGHGWREN